MPYLLEPLSAAQIHSVYASKKTKPSAPAVDSGAPHYAKTSFAGRDPGHPGSPPPRPEPESKKKRR
ncbi:hypothetical protein ISP15_10280 [Dyella jejuensis]|uniref:Uncharacterized protein n=1 Tax=Dyella jejuensis TaxID=1432009 RepID=A0ABW8JHZ3_9GAMM